jgi:hypothetical protein
MSFLNSAFDSSTIMNTNINLMKKFSPISLSSRGVVANSASGLLLKQQETFSNSNTNISNNNTPTFQRKTPFQSSSIALGGASGLNSTATNNASVIGTNSTSVTNLNNNYACKSQSNLNNVPGKSSISINNHFHKSSSISSKTIDEKTLISQIQTRNLTLNSKAREYCSKTQLYCEAVSRALDISTCKVVPFFSAFLHDLRFIIESVPSVTIMCDKNVQKPIEVSFKINLNSCNIST